MSETVKTVLTLLGGGTVLGAVFTFLQFLITRHDNKKNMEKLIKDEVGSVRDECREIRKEIKENKEEDEKYRAEQARLHILAFSDELRNGYGHSEEYFKQILLDIDTYNTYCRTHRNFENGRTKLSSEYIYETYRKQYLVVEA